MSPDEVFTVLAAVAIAHLLTASPFSRIYRAAVGRLPWVGHTLTRCSFCAAFWAAVSLGLVGDLAVIPRLFVVALMGGTLATLYSAAGSYLIGVWPVEEPNAEDP